MITMFAAPLAPLTEPCSSAGLARVLDARS